MGGTNQTEWCDTCRATVDVHKSNGAIYCDNCDTPLFDRDGNEIIKPKAVA